MSEGMRPEPDLDDPVQRIVHRAMTALLAEFDGDAEVPRFAIVAEAPPEGRIGIASTGDDSADVHRMLALGAASVRASMGDDQRESARRLWATMKAGFEGDE